MDLQRKFWVEGRSQGVWAVELRGHEIVACCGPLTLDEADDDLLDALEYTDIGVAWIRENAEHFTPLVTQVPEIFGT